MTVDELSGPFNRMLEQLCSPATIRGVEVGVDDGSSWRALSDSGFLDAMVPEADGGAGLSPSAVAPLFIACGWHLLPYAFAETLVARALAAMAGQQLPSGSVVLWPEDETGRLRSLVAPPAGAASHALVQRGSRVVLQPMARTPTKPDGFHISGAALQIEAAPLLSFELPDQQLMNWAAALTAASMAGAMSRVLEMTLQHVNTRQQFDRPLAKFQAIQQQVSVMAERVASASVAARLALARDLPGPNSIDAAVGKIIANAAVTLVAAVAHAAHGAIGITAEHDLSLYVRRLKRWQLSFGSTEYWAKLIGAARLDYTTGTSVDFLRAQRACGESFG
jgi:acyl-CoA dehydrogenase